MTTDDLGLGRTLRQWRDRVSPAVAGLPAHDRRRASGLRREELAQLAGVSADYLTRLEQGRSTAPSVPVLSALARALRLTGAERDHLFRLAGQAVPDDGRISGELPPGVQRLLDRLDDTPVAVYDAAWTLLAGNRLWAALTGDQLSRQGRDRNVIWQHFTGDGGHVIRTPEETAEFEQEMVADLRGALGQYPRDDDLARLIDDLIEASARFAELWSAGAVAVHSNSRKIIDHPEVGPVVVDCDILTVRGTDLRIIAYSADPGSEAAEKLARLRVGHPGTVPVH